MFAMMLAGWVNAQHRAVNAYLKEENRVLRELHGNRLIEEVPELASGPVVRQERLGGILSHYYREAA